MCWVAKNSITGEVLSKSFDSIYDCQKYIDEFIDNNKLLEDYKKDLKDKLREKLKIRYDKIPENSIIKLLYGTYENYVDFVVYLEFSFKFNIVRCYNVDQERFADGFDF